MNHVLEHWSFDPFLVIAIVVAAWHEIGLARLAARSRPERTRQRRRRSVFFYAGLAVLLIAVVSPIDYWADDYFFVHTIQHLLLMFAAPTLIVAGAPWQPLLDALPGESGKAATRQTLTAGWSKPLRAVAGSALRPWVAVALFNVVMLVWHLPAPYDLAERNQVIHIWLMHGSYFAVGILFWLQFLPSPPFRTKMTPVAQGTALMATNCVTLGLALALGVLTSTSWYAVYAHVPGITLPPVADQQIGAGILWICGTCFAIPTMVLVFRRLMARDEPVSAAASRMLGRGSARYNWASRGTGRT